MGKKIPLFIATLTLLLSGFSPNQNTFAEEKDYWTEEEMAILETTVWREIIESCEGANTSCMKRTYINIRNKGGQYAALEEYSMRPLVISAINPSKGTISVFFREEYLRGKLSGRMEKESVSSLYITRFEKGKEDFMFAEKIQKGEELPEGAYLAVAESEEKNGENWLRPNEETTFDMIDGTFGDNIVNKAWFYFENKVGGAWLDSLSFDSFINSAEYQDGMECRLVYTAKGAKYIPQLIEEPTAEPEPYESSTTPPAEETTPTKEKAQQEIPTPLAPDTSAVQEGNTQAIERPWWIVALIVSGEMLLVWWAVPTKYAKIQKKLKKPKKSIDNTNPV